MVKLGKYYFADVLHVRLWIVYKVSFDFFFLNIFAQWLHLFQGHKGNICSTLDILLSYLSILDTVFLKEFCYVMNIDEIADLVVKNDIENVDLHNLLRVFTDLIPIRLVNQKGLTFIWLFPFFLLLNVMPNNYIS